MDPLDIRTVYPGRQDNGFEHKDKVNKADEVEVQLEVEQRVLKV